jgi:hypothetical protein
MRDFSDEFLEGYLAAEAGSVTMFDAIERDYSAILGLPPLSLLCCCRFFDGSACS